MNLRRLSKNPVRMITVVATLGIATGLVTTIFSLANAAILRPLPYEDSSRLAMIWSAHEKRGKTFVHLSPIDFAEFRRRSRSFDALGAVRPTSCTLSGDSEPVEVRAGYVSADFFHVLGVRPILGRAFGAAEHETDESDVALISRDLWRRRFGGGSDVLGRNIRIEGGRRTIVGVMEERAEFPQKGLSVWLPMVREDQDVEQRHFLFAVGRLKQGVSRTEAATELRGVLASLSRQLPDSHRGWDVQVERPLAGILVPVRRATMVLLAASGCVLLIACVNVAGLQFAGLRRRSREIALRTALGASRWRIFGAILGENMVVGVNGALAGLGLSFWGTSAIESALPGNLPLPTTLTSFSPDWRVLVFTLLIASLAGFLIGLGPALVHSRADLAYVLRMSQGLMGGSGRASRYRTVFIGFQIAVALALVVGATLLTSSLLRLMRVDPGFAATNVVSLQLSLSRGRYSSADSQRTFARSLLARINALPKARQVGLVNYLPLSGEHSSFTLSIEGRSGSSPRTHLEAEEKAVTPGYFSAIGIPLRAGRVFTDADTAGAPAVAIVNRSFVDRFFQGDDPIGGRIRAGGSGSNAPWETIVGVVGNVRQSNLAASVSPEVYRSFWQQPWGRQSFVVRSPLDLETLAPMLKAAVWRTDADQPITEITTMNQVVSRSLWAPSLLSGLVALFAAGAMALVGVGLWGLVSQTVEQKTPELGIRAALGASSAMLVARVMRQAIAALAIGLALGMPLALAFHGFSRSLLAGGNVFDVTGFGAGLIVLLSIVLLAAYLPARRAAKVDPMEALRCE